MRKSLSALIIWNISLLLVISGIGIVSAVTYPVGVPSGEVAGGTFNTYFSNMFSTIGISESAPTYIAGCQAGEVMRGLTSSGMLLCISPGLGSTSSATLSLSGSLIGTPNYIAKYTPTGTGINNSQIYDNGTNIGIANLSPAYKLDVAGTGSFYGLRVSSGAVNNYVLTSDAAGLATWRVTGYPCIATGVGIHNTCYGSNSLQNNTSGQENTAIGLGSLGSNTTGYSNTANGYNALNLNTTGVNNTAVGFNSLYSNTAGFQNTAIGFNSLYSNITGLNNTANGYGALYSNTVGFQNTAIGFNSLYFNTTGNYNTAIGFNAGQNITSGGNNIAIGSNTDFPTGLGSNQLNIGNAIFGIGLSGTVGVPAGNIGIGTVNPTAKLEIAGQIKITGGSPGSGKTLVSDASGLAIWADTVSGSTATGIVSGAGNQNYIPKFGSGGIGIYSSQLYDDGFNVGVGTITPGAKLEVVGQIKITGGSPGVNKVLSSDAAGLATWVSLSSVSGVWSILGNSGTIAGTNFVGTTDGQDLVFKTNNTEAARILTTGNVGIGTATPGAKLEVAGQVKITGGGIGSGKVLTSDATGLATWVNAPSPCIASGTGVDNRCYDLTNLQLNTGGMGNSAYGIFGLNNNTTGSDNTALGSYTLMYNTTGYRNTAMGREALNANTTGYRNTAVGFATLATVTTGSSNTAIGYATALGISTGSANTVIGSNVNSLAPGLSNNIIIADGDGNQRINVTSTGNVGIGTPTPGAKLEVAGQVKITGGGIGSGKVLTSDSTGLATWTTAPSPCIPTGTGTDNTCYGINALQVNSIGSSNTANGSRALSSNTLGNQNTANGVNSLRFNTVGNQNTANGLNALGSNTGGSSNTADGWQSLYLNTTGNYNTAIGNVALTNNINGNYNTALGYQAGSNLVLGDSNIFIGYNAQPNIGTGASSQLNIGNWIYGNGGNIGIGALNPTARLEVAGQVKITGGAPGLGKILTSDAAGLATWSNTPTLTNTWNIIGNSGTVAGTNFLGTTDAIDLVFKTNNVEAARILTSGNVGIGTPTPGAKLEVAGQVRIATAGAYLDYRPNGVNCTNGQILSWNNASTRWECSSNAPGISGSGLTTNYVTKWNGTSIANSQLFDNGTNVGIGTAIPGSKFEVVGNSYFNGNVTVSGSLIVDKIVNRTVNNISISGSLLPDSGAPLVYRDIGSTSQRWNNLYLSGQVAIAGGSPGLGKVLTSDASGLAVWSSTISGATATGITGGTQNYIPKFGTGGTGLYLSQFFDNGTNVGIGTAIPGAKLEVAGQIKITGGAPGAGKMLVSDATGLASWTGVVTATGLNIGGAVLGSTLYYNGTAWTAGTGIYNTGGNIGIGTAAPTTRLTIDSGITGSGGLRLSRISATTTPYSGPNVGLGVDGSGNLVPVSNGDVVVYTARGRNGVQPVPDPDLPNRLIGYNFNTYFAIPTSQSFVVSDGNGAGYNAPYFKENGTSGICSGGGSPYDCAVADPFTGLSASPNNSFTMTAKGSTYGYQMALGARGDAPLFARSGRFTGAQTNGLFLSDGVTPTPWQKVLTVPANHLEYFYVNIGYNSQLQAIAGGGNVGIGTSIPDRRLVISGSGNTTSTTQQVLIRRGIPGADATLGNTYGTPYMNIGGQENRVNSIQTIGFGKSGLGAAGYAPAEIGFLTTSVAGFTQGDIVFANRNGTTNAIPTEVMRIESTGDVGIGVSNPSQQLTLSKSMSIPATTSASTGVIYKGATRFLHNYTSSALSPNIFLGLNAGNFTMTSGYNIGIGDSALVLNTIGFNNMALGYLALSNNTTGANNAAIGSESLELNQTGNNNVANGFKSLYANLTGGNNTSIGTESLTSNDIGSNNTANGYQAMNANTSGNSNVAIGAQSLFTNVSGQFNTAIGYQALRVANSPSNNTAIGYQAGNAITTGASNIVIGANAQVGSPTGSNQLSIGNWLYGSGGNIGIGIAAPIAKLEVAGNFKLGTNGTVTTAAGVCTIASTAITTTAATYTCTGVPASTAVAIHCNAAAAFTTPNTTSLYCRANGTLNQVVCNTTVANAVATTYKCMWMQ